MRNLKMTVAYVGTRFAGWQVQPGRETIQGVLEDRLGRLLGEPVRIAGAGRTDAGVHARGQVASFLTASRIPPEGLLRGLNARLPEDIRTLAVEEAPGSFHARASARGKEYRYRIARAAVLSPFEAPFAAVIRGPIDGLAMREAAGAFIGAHDFTSFCPAACRVEGKVRTVSLSRIDEDGIFLDFTVRADGFLQHMMRTMAGTLIEVGRGRIAPAAIAAILERRDRRAAGPCAPPRGLTLERVFYGEDA